MLQENFWNVHIRRYTFVTCIFFLCKLEQALEVSYVNYMNLSTQQLASAPGIQVSTLLQWQVLEDTVLQACKCRGVKWLAASRHPTLFQRNMGNTPLQHSCTLSCVTRSVCCTHFYIILAIQSHTLILLLIALSAYGVVLPQTSWIPFLISLLSPNFEHPKLEIQALIITCTHYKTYTWGREQRQPAASIAEFSTMCHSKPGVLPTTQSCP